MIHHAFKLALGPILYAQARRLRRIAIELPEPDGERDGFEGDGTAPLKLLVAGDSSAAGVGAETQDQALGRPLARELATRIGRGVEWRLVARSGLTSEGVFDLLRTGPIGQADVAVIIVGVNDLTNDIPLSRAMRCRAQMVHWLRAHASTRHVLFTSMPEMHRFPLIPAPLAWYAGMHAQRNNRMQKRLMTGLPGGGHVDLTGLMRAEWMARDGYHPAPPLYAKVAHRIADTIVPLVPGIDQANDAARDAQLSRRT